VAVGLTGDDPRCAELAARLATVRDRVSRACAAAGRSPDSVTVIAVTKYFPAEDIRRLARLGISEIGESRDQEARSKVAELGAGAGLVWHFIGQLQRNKARSVAAYADLVHTVDRPELVRALDTAAGRLRERPLPVLLQVDLAADDLAADGRAGAGTGRGGAPAAQLPALAEAVTLGRHLRLAGLMAVAPRGVDPELAFARLAAVVERFRSDHPGAGIVSAGMSGDLEEAVRFGATHLRVGTALLGGRPTAVR
jgi:pyridoxal phosphate enzyme (YggS family)